MIFPKNRGECVSEPPRQVVIDENSWSSATKVPGRKGGRRRLGLPTRASSPLAGVLRVLVEKNALVRPLDEVARLEALCREAPNNWFNFHEYWLDGPVAPSHRLISTKAMVGARSAKRIADFFTYVTEELKVDGITGVIQISPP